MQIEVPGIPANFASSLEENDWVAPTAPHDDEPVAASRSRAASRAASRTRGLRQSSQTTKSQTSPVLPVTEVPAKEGGVGFEVPTLLAVALAGGGYYIYNSSTASPVSPVVQNSVQGGDSVSAQNPKGQDSKVDTPSAKVQTKNVKPKGQNKKSKSKPVQVAPVVQAMSAESIDTSILSASDTLESYQPWEKLAGTLMDRVNMLKGVGVANGGFSTRLYNEPEFQTGRCVEYSTPGAQGFICSSSFAMHDSSKSSEDNPVVVLQLTKPEEVKLEKAENGQMTKTIHAKTHYLVGFLGPKEGTELEMDAKKRNVEIFCRELKRKLDASPEDPSKAVEETFKHLEDYYNSISYSGMFTIWNQVQRGLGPDGKQEAPLTFGTQDCGLTTKNGAAPKEPVKATVVSMGGFGMDAIIGTNDSTKDISSNEGFEFNNSKNLLSTDKIGIQEIEIPADTFGLLMYNKKTGEADVQQIGLGLSSGALNAPFEPKGEVPANGETFATYNLVTSLDMQ